ncbi:MAG: glycosyltransferase [Paludibacteraceae bacterium]|nr:glycosyltransferase [Paludibacteraceae bacterium]
MYEVALPISKSIANRILLLQAIHGDPLMRVSADMPDDVVVLHDALEQLREYKKGEPLTLYLKNNGTALRFLQVHLEKCYPGAPITLTGDPRLMERDGAPTTQTTSARILHGEDIPVAENESPYITMSRRIKERYEGAMYDVRRMNEGGKEQGCERDWSAAAFWYEYVAIHGGELLLEGLRAESLQGDRVVADIYAKYFGVKTEFVPEGAVISTKDGCTMYEGKAVSIDFTNCPDLYPAVALTCEHLGITLDATGTERLRYKECDRIEAVQRHEVRNDHRMAMALMAAGAYPPQCSTDGHRLSDRAELFTRKGKGEELQQIIAKSYPQFIEIFKQVHAESRRSTDGEPTVTTYVTDTPLTHITPIKGVNDDNLGKKHALSKLIHAAQTEYVWLHDDDVIWPEAAKKPNLTFPKGKEHSADLYILPLMMESSLPSGRGGVGSLLQIAEYAAIQELTMRTAKAGRAVMCSGANLIVRREAWLECESELHPEIPSGDDMFLLEAMKRRGMRITVIDEPDYTAVVRPVSTWRSFWRQRMRWAGKAPHYTDKDILRCGALVAAANILQLLFPPVILIKFPIEYSLIKKREPRTLWYVALLLELLYPFYMLISLVGGLLRGKQW